ncbi:hypothetical protein DFAR_2110003 [Desulfarculales bacterium]
MARSHLAGVSLQDIKAYLLRYLKIVGAKQNLFSDPAVTAIQQGFGGSSEGPTIWPEARS